MQKSLELLGAAKWIVLIIMFSMFLVDKDAPQAFSLAKWGGVTLTNLFPTPKRVLSGVPSQKLTLSVSEHRAYMCLYNLLPPVG